MTVTNEPKEEMPVQTAATAALCRGSMYAVSRCWKTLLLTTQKLPRCRRLTKKQASCLFFFDIFFSRNRKKKKKEMWQFAISFAPPPPSTKHCFLIAGSTCQGSDLYIQLPSATGSQMWFWITSNKTWRPDLHWLHFFFIHFRSSRLHVIWSLAILTVTILSYSGHQVFWKS